MSEPFLGEIKLVSFNFPPRGWALCNGQILSIAQNTALFSVLGTTYGGNGQTTFALPDLQGRTPLHFGAGVVQGESGGEIAHTLIGSELPAHSHTVAATSAAASALSPVGNVWATTSVAAYGPSPNTALAAATTASGGSQPHENQQPYLVLSFIIAIQGIFPSRN